jgi:hypothetical protein
MIVQNDVPHWPARGQRRVAACLKYLPAVLLALLLIALGGHLDVAIARSSQGPMPAYSVDQIRADLTHHPMAWVDRTVRVRGILQGPFVFCGATRPCPPPIWGLIDAENESVAPDLLLPVKAGAPAPLWAALRRLPLVRTIVPAPQVMRFGLPTTYRLQLRVAPALCRANTGLLCYEGVVVDAAQPAS